MKQEAVQSLVQNTRMSLNIYKFPNLAINLGWIGGCNFALEKMEDCDYVVLVNDDILMPAVCDWCENMVNVMEDNLTIGAVGPVTNNAMGWSRIAPFNCTLKRPIEVPYLAFFMVMLRTEAIRKVGLLDKDLPGGDDLDYCLRLRENGYKIAITPNVFVWHYYAQTGKKLYGNYWDSEEHTEKINNALIRKHGFKKYINSKYVMEGSHTKN